MRFKATSPGTSMMGISSLDFYLVTANAACIIARMPCLQLILLAGILFTGPDLARAQKAVTRVFVDANHNIPRDTREFYRPFYHIDLSDEQLNQLSEHTVVGDDKTR